MSSDVQGTNLKLNNFRIQQSLGTQIGAVTNVTTKGYTVLYKEGDLCNEDEGYKFTS